MTRSAAAVASVALLSLLIAGCATPPNVKKDPRDPFERFNRASYKFTDVVDRAVLKPVAKGYKAVAPQFVETGVTNFFNNLTQPRVMVNDFLQGKFRAGFEDTGRFLLNTTVGIGGLFDPASRVGLERGDEDFGQTLGKWGAGAGPYLWIPLLGPSTVRDGFGRGVDIFANPLRYVDRVDIRNILAGVDLVNTRAQLLSVEAATEQAFDRYSFLRNAYLQQREYAIKDGNVESPTFDDDEFEDPEPEADETPPDTK